MYLDIKLNIMLLRFIMDLLFGIIVHVSKYENDNLKFFPDIAKIDALLQHYISDYLDFFLSTCYTK